MDEIEELKARIVALEKESFLTTKFFYVRTNNLEKTINWLSIATSFSFLVAFLLIAHIARYI